jgi:hypothetical protein
LARKKRLSVSNHLSIGWVLRQYEDLYLGELKKQLEFAETTPLVGGWKSNPSLQTRLQTFFKSRITKVLSEFSHKANPIYEDFGGSLLASNLHIWPLY